MCALKTVNFITIINKYYLIVSKIVRNAFNVKKANFLTKLLGYVKYVLMVKTAPPTYIVKNAIKAINEVLIFKSALTVQANNFLTVNIAKNKNALLAFI